MHQGAGIPKSGSHRFGRTPQPIHVPCYPRIGCGGTGDFLCPQAAGIRSGGFVSIGVGLCRLNSSGDGGDFAVLMECGRGSGVVGMSYGSNGAAGVGMGGGESGGIGNGFYSSTRVVGVGCGKGF